MSNLVSKLKHWVAGDHFEDDLYDYDDDGYEYDEAPEAEPVAAQPTRSERRNLKVIDHPNSAQMAQVVVQEPRSFDEALEIIHYLKSRKAVILNLHLLDTAQSQRVVDFLSGATHAIEGHQQRIGDGVFIFTPSNVMVSANKGSSEEALSLSEAYWNTPSR